MERLGKLTLTDLALQEKDFAWCKRITEIAKVQPEKPKDFSFNKAADKLANEDSKVSDFNRLLKRVSVAIDEDNEFQVAIFSNIIISYVTKMDEETREIIKPELAKITKKITSYRNSKLGEDNEDYDDYYKNDKYFDDDEEEYY